MSDIAQQDIAYQPTTKAYSLPPNQVVPSNPEPELEPKPKGKPNVFVLLILEILGLLVVFAVFLLVLNYFRIISLPNFIPAQLEKLPQATQPPAPTYDSKLGLWTAKGTFYGYNNYTLKITINNQVTNFQWANSTAALYGSEKNFSDQNYTPTPYTLYDLEQNQNLGKKVIIQYEIQNGKNVIDSLNLFKL